MTYHTSDDWSLPPRGPQHAAPFTGFTPLHQHTRRALRLIVTAGAWGAGLCLVIASVALVAEATGSGHPPGGIRSGQLAGQDTNAGQQLATAGPASEIISRTFDGTGDRVTAAFKVAAHSRWKLSWTFRCPAGTPHGQLIIRQGDAAGGGVSVDALGPAGQGSAWTFSDASEHYLVVITSCAWTATVLSRP
jgi:hypothetical protein